MLAFGKYKLVINQVEINKIDYLKTLKLGFDNLKNLQSHKCTLEGLSNNKLKQI